MHRTGGDFWDDYWALPAGIRDRADRQFALLKANQRHPSLHFKKLTTRNGQEIWSARVTSQYRALAFKVEGGYVWFWIGQHGVYDGII